MASISWRYIRKKTISGLENAAFQKLKSYENKENKEILNCFN